MTKKFAHFFRHNCLASSEVFYINESDQVAVTISGHEMLIREESATSCSLLFNAANVKRWKGRLTPDTFVEIMEYEHLFYCSYRKVCV